MQAICEKLDIDYKNLYKTIQSYNDSCIENAVIDFSCLDYCGAVDCFGIKKSNWAQRIDKPPYFIAPVRTGLTFTYGGLKIDVDARVCMTDGNCVKNLFACGEIVGGIHYGNYAGGTGLMLGSVFGKIAGENA